MIPHDPEERRALIGEYLLGLLDGAEADEVRQLLEHDEDAARMALDWERHFLELSDRLPSQAPSPALWVRIRRSLGLHDEPRPSALANWWNSLLTWRLTAATLAVALLVAVLLPILRSPDIAGERYTVVLQQPGEAAKPGWVIQVGSDGTLLLDPLVADQVPEGRALQFWTLIDPAEGPRSLGLVEAGKPLRLPAEQIGAVQAGQLFELTLEPAGGSPYDRPSGPVLYIGRAVLASAN
ncbi:anti-sigma-K factor RskA [Pseudomonas sp. EGD-AK9]|uniref:anti-sigma factor n=1 Tax=Pseudomonas sp. EGD-AK9 TaxID=1386078 RepID=UPI000397BED0|nr:anti-sigma factor [Pseudomonas sp. EGD-AK9]ERI52713.1 anti-sigma-K factor RskA [Pseudomonas sp. EGD-AK9]